MAAKRNTLSQSLSKSVAQKFIEDPEMVQEPRTVPISAIYLSNTQPRRYFDPEKLSQLVESVSQHGILEPLLVRPNPSNGYLLVAGERRLIAAKKVGLSKVPIILKKLTDQQALEIALVENLQREDLNPVDETEGILQLLALSISKTTDEVITVLNKANHAKSREQKLEENVFLQFEQIESILAQLGKFSAESFRTSRLPLLNLPKEILESLRQGKLEYTKARVISRIKDEQIRSKILNEAVENNLSLNEIKAIINDLKPSANKKVSKTVQKFYDRVSIVTTRLKKSQAWTDKNKRKQAELLLKELENLAE